MGLVLAERIAANIAAKLAAAAKEARLPIRFLFSVLALLVAVVGAPGNALAEPSFRAYIESLWPLAQKAGVRRDVFDRSLRDLTPDREVIGLTTRQPEFQLSVGAYLRKAMPKVRLAKGRDLAKKHAELLDRIEKEFGVERTVVLAIWGAETDFGAAFGNKDVFRSLVTLAHARFRDDFFRDELIDALLIQQSEKLEPHAMRGSWAGAMGQPQFLPSSFRKHAVDFDGDGRRDIWKSIPDTLASIANYLRHNGWKRGMGWGLPVEVPASYDLREGRGDFPAWKQRGVTAVRSDMPAAGRGNLFHPSGFPGPAFLVTENFDVIKTYNFSDAYALAIGLIADGIRGQPGLDVQWPDRIPLARPDRILLQQRLAARGFEISNFQGRMDFAIRDAVRVMQVKFSMVPDGEPTAALLKALGER